MKKSNAILPTVVPLKKLPAHLRKARGKLTQAAAARQARVNRITYFRAERGDNINAATYIALLKWAMWQGA